MVNRLVANSGRPDAGPSIQKSSRVLKKYRLVGKMPETTDDFVIPAKAGIQSFLQPFDF